MSSRVKVMK